MQKFWSTLLVLLLVTLLGCSHQAPKEDKAQYDAFTQKFADKLVAGDLQGAYNMTCTSYQLQASFEKFKQQYAEAAATTRPSKVQLDSGKLPKSEEDGQKTYGFPPDVKMATWRAWTFAELTTDGGGGFEARLLIIDDNGTLKAGYVEFGPIS